MRWSDDHISQFAHHVTELQLTQRQAVSSRNTSGGFGSCCGSFTMESCFQRDQYGGSTPALLPVYMSVHGAAMPPALSGTEFLIVEQQQYVERAGNNWCSFTWWFSKQLICFANTTRCRCPLAYKYMSKTTRTWMIVHVFGLILTILELFIYNLLSSNNSVFKLKYFFHDSSIHCTKNQTMEMDFFPPDKWFGTVLSNVRLVKSETLRLSI